MRPVSKVSSGLTQAHGLAHKPEPSTATSAVYTYWSCLCDQVAESYLVSASAAGARSKGVKSPAHSGLGFRV